MQRRLQCIDSDEIRFQELPCAPWNMTAAELDELGLFHPNTPHVTWKETSSSSTPPADPSTAPPSSAPSQAPPTSLRSSPAKIEMDAKASEFVPASASFHHRMYGSSAPLNPPPPPQKQQLHRGHSRETRYPPRPTTAQKRQNSDQPPRLCPVQDTAEHVNAPVQNSVQQVVEGGLSGPLPLRQWVEGLLGKRVEWFNEKDLKSISQVARKNLPLECRTPDDRAGPKGIHPIHTYVRIETHGSCSQRALFEIGGGSRELPIFEYCNIMAAQHPECCIPAPIPQFEPVVTTAGRVGSLFAAASSPNARRRLSRKVRNGGKRLRGKRKPKKKKETSKERLLGLRRRLLILTSPLPSPPPLRLSSRRSRRRGGGVGGRRERERRKGAQPTSG
uniref:Uncharacterized protein n=1 Tax=Chromera velia CCMP2878 TaxID=1169474 RepID=A0A0G4F4U7_9ALVE|eukprot:Cvel_15237.t1-p1 / transcript=Cvel_15237.t1 / gene=Cvel_15237 / organism=Chromera_velia_CCMP2878 / gene_product=hypothetical protein / transcript_product=hypothetical protein / location=Cvel_scaffold1115:33152-35496(-) / protein_length=388 / sequence_SO=supercontig / SO=protein_coding / is_pseudo=false